MSRWQGDSNPGHQRRLAQWREIEQEFGEPVHDTIQGLRAQGNTWRTVAGALGVSLSTLQDWRRALGLPLDSHVQIYDPSSLPKYTPTDRKARALGYEDATDAVLDMRLCQGLTLWQAARRLGVHPQTVSDYTPRRLRDGSIYNRSARWWKVRREQARRLKHSPPDNHPWRRSSQRGYVINSRPARERLERER